jgi:predicted nucleic acid-binding Zn ribbon protein
MDCPNCGTWNPEDKEVCWRCQTPLPKPVQKKKRKSAMFWGLPVWMWIVLGLFLVASSLGQCVFLGGGVGA